MDTSFIQTPTYTLQKLLLLLLLLLHRLIQFSDLHTHTFCQFFYVISDVFSSHSPFYNISTIHLTYMFR